MASARYDFERYLNVRTAYGASFSPDGKQLSFLTDITGVAEVWSVHDTADGEDGVPEWPEQVTFRGERVASAAYAPHENALLVAGDVGGNERTQLYLVSGDGSDVRALTDRPEVIYQFGGWSPDGKRICIASNERDQRYFDVYEMDVASGEKRLLLQQDGTNYAASYSPDGETVLVDRADTNVRTTLLGVHVPSGTVRQLTPDQREGMGSTWRRRSRRTARGSTC
jgi:Tol biopolymer transport system component